MSDMLQLVGELPNTQALPPRHTALSEVVTHRQAEAYRTFGCAGSGSLSFLQLERGGTALPHLHLSKLELFR